MNRLLLPVTTFFVAVIALLGASTVRAETVEDALDRLDAMIAEMQTLRSDLVTLLNANTGTPAVQGVQTSSVFTQSLAYGETNDDIAKIQKLLATDPAIYPYGVSSGFFGPKTQEAIRNLQTRFNLDPVGVIGPATRALLESYFRVYPNENYPTGVLSVRPTVLGASVSKPTTPASPTVSGTNPAASIDVEFDEGEAWIDIEYTNGKEKTLVVDTEDEDDVVEYIVDETTLTTAQVRAVISFDKKRSKKSSDADEDDAEDAIDDAEDAIDDAEEEIEEADDDGDDVDWAEDTLEEAEDLLEEAEEAFDDEDYDEAVELAEEAEELAEKAIDRIDEEKSQDADDIESIEVVIFDGTAEVTVEYEDGSDKEFDIDEDDEDDIIEAIADKLDLDEDDVEDLVEFEYEYGDLDEIVVTVKSKESLVRVWFDDGTKKSFTTTSTDEDDIIEEIADRYDLDEDDIEDIIEFD